MTFISELHPSRWNLIT